MATVVAGPDLRAVCDAIGLAVSRRGMVCVRGRQRRTRPVQDQREAQQEAKQRCNRGMHRAKG